MSDEHRPLTEAEAMMARELCDLVTSWSFGCSFGCSLAHAHDLMDEVWCDETAAAWFATARGLRDKQLRRMTDAMEEEGVDS